MSNNEFSNNLSKYANPKEYDESYKSYTADLEFIEDHLEGRKQTIIELACGTGRLAIPLARKGHFVYGVDIHAGMLKYAQEKADDEGLNIHLSVQDCTQLNLPIKSNFIYMTGNSFQHFLTNESQDALFMSVKKHLNANGELIFDTRNPILYELSNVAIRLYAVILRKEYPPVPPLSCRYFFIRRTPNTASSTCHPASFYHAPSTYHPVKVLTSSCSPPHTRHQPDNTRAGKDSHSIMIVIIIIISIR